MPLRLIQFIAVMLTALALVPGGAHLAAMPSKLALGRDDYFVVQQIFDGWALFGIALIGALLVNLTHALMLGRLRRPRAFAFVATALIAANQATSNWKTVPENWDALRLQWEYSHAVNAVVMLAALACVTIAVLRQRLH